MKYECVYIVHGGFKGGVKKLKSGVEAQHMVTQPRQDRYSLFLL